MYNTIFTQIAFIKIEKHKNGRFEFDSLKGNEMKKIC